MSVDDDERRRIYALGEVIEKPIWDFVDILLDDDIQTLVRRIGEVKPTVIRLSTTSRAYSLSESAIAPLLKMLSEIKKLEIIDLEGQPNLRNLGDKFTLPLSEALKEIDFTATYMEIPNGMLMSIFSNATLMKLNLRTCKVDWSLYKQNLSKLSKLEVLGLPSGGGKDDLKQITFVLASLQRLKSLSISSTPPPSFVQAIASLSTLEIYGQDTDVTALLTISGLKSLTLFQPSLGPFCEAVLHGSRQNLIELQELKLFVERDEITLPQALKRLAKLQRLTLFIHVDSLMTHHFAHVLPPNLISLNYRHLMNGILCQDLRGLLTNLKSLHTLDLGGNNFVEDNFQTITDYLENITSLRTLYLRACNLNKFTNAKTCLQKLKDNSKITHLCLAGNQLDFSRSDDRQESSKSLSNSKNTLVYLFGVVLLCIGLGGIGYVITHRRSSGLARGSHRARIKSRKGSNL